VLVALTGAVEILSVCAVTHRRIVTLSYFRHIYYCMSRWHDTQYLAQYGNRTSEGSGFHPQQL